MDHVQRLDEELSRRFGHDWRGQPYDPLRPALLRSAAGQDRAWGALRDEMQDAYEDADVPEDLDVAVPVLVELVAPRDDEVEVEVAGVQPLADDGIDLDVVVAAAHPLATRFEASGMGAGAAAFEAVLTLVASGHPALAAADPSSVAAVERWTTAWNVAVAVLAARLAKAGADVERQYGPALRFAAGENTWTPDELDVAYRAAAERYVGWQQQQVCHCGLVGRPCPPDTTPKHHLHRWTPGAPKQARNLAEWFRTWVVGQQRSNQLKPGGLEGGIYFRVFLRRPGTPVRLYIGETLTETCVQEGCEGGKALRLTASMPVAVGRRRQRACPHAVDHDLDFALPPEKRTRELVFVGPRDRSHQQYEDLRWDRGAQRWSFVEHQANTNTRWLPLPHGPAWDHLCSRPVASQSGWTAPVLPDPDDERYADSVDDAPPAAAADDRLGAGPLSGSQPPADLTVLDVAVSPALVNSVVDVLDHTEDPAERFAEWVELLEPVGVIDAGLSCQSCKACTSYGPTFYGHPPDDPDRRVEPAGRRHCPDKLNEVMRHCLQEVERDG